MRRQADRVGLCIVGCGRFATFHARAARALGRDVARAFASRDGARTEAYRRRFGGVAAFGDYGAAGADPRVVALVACTPHHLYLDHVRLAARHGKAVLLEKPIARTVEEADRILAEAEAARIPLMVAENFHIMPAFVAAGQLLASGAIGGVRQILISARGYRHPAGWRRRRVEAGGGALIDGGVHYVRLLHDCGGPIARVSAAAPPNLFDDVEGEDTAYVLVRFPGGRRRRPHRLDRGPPAAPPAVVVGERERGFARRRQPGPASLAPERAREPGPRLPPGRARPAGAARRVPGHRA